MHPLQPASTAARALRDVSFDVHRGEFFGIVGATGPASARC